MESYSFTPEIIALAEVDQCIDEDRVTSVQLEEAYLKALDATTEKDFDKESFDTLPRLIYDALIVGVAANIFLEMIASLKLKETEYADEEIDAIMENLATEVVFEDFVEELQISVNQKQALIVLSESPYTCIVRCVRTDGSIKEIVIEEDKAVYQTIQDLASGIPEDTQNIEIVT